MASELGEVIGSKDGSDENVIAEASTHESGAEKAATIQHCTSHWYVYILYINSHMAAAILYV